jgi:hypothetical protein
MNQKQKFMNQKQGGGQQSGQGQHQGGQQQGGHGGGSMVAKNA